MKDRPKCNPAPSSSHPSSDDLGFEESRVFRETFLHRFTAGDDREVLRRFGGILFDLALGYEDDSPAGGEEEGNYLAVELCAAGADLRHLEGYLLYLEEQKATCQLNPEEVILAGLAGRLARVVGRVAGEIEGAVGSPPER